MEKVLGIVAHDTGNPSSTAWQNVRYYQNSRDQMSASAHFFIDDRDIIECIPALSTTPEKAWHVRYDCGKLYNDHCIGVELCYGGHIKLTEAYKRYIYIMAYICDRYDIDPLTKIYGHFELDPKRKTDPKTPLKLLQKDMETLQEDVYAELLQCRK